MRACKPFLLSFIVMFCCFAAKAAGDTLYYVGNIIISKNVSFKYNLRFAINSKNEVTGYSLTDAGGANETKVKITGTYDTLKKTLTFEEKGILRTKIDQSQKDLCFVKATLDYKYTKVVESFAGTFTGFKPGSTETCATGEIKLINAKTVQNTRSLMDEITFKKRKDTSAKATEAKPVAEGRKKILEVADEKGIVLPFTGDSARLTVWDNGKIDGDKITIMFNSTYLIKDLTLDSAKKVMSFPLTNNVVDTIKVIALNEGDIAPNTVLIKVESSTESYPIEVRAEMNEVRRIFLKKKNAGRK